MEITGLQRSDFVALLKEQLGLSEEWIDGGILRTEQILRKDVTFMIPAPAQP